MDQAISIHHPDPAIQALVHSAASSLPQLQEAFEAGYMPDGASALSPEHQAALFQTVQQLCGEGNFLHAAPIAVQLAAHHPDDGGFAFAAGRVLQRLAAFDGAALFYGQSLRLRKTPTAMYRLGECLAGLGHAEAAIEAFDTAFDLARGDAQYRDLQDSAAQAMAWLRLAGQRAN